MRQIIAAYCLGTPSTTHITELQTKYANKLPINI